MVIPREKPGTSDEAEQKTCTRNYIRPGQTVVKRVIKVPCIKYPPQGILLASNLLEPLTT